jgi:pyruvate formate lyase activating enzyme
MARKTSPFRRFLPGEQFLSIESRGSGLRPARPEPVDVWWEGLDGAPRLTPDEALFLARAWGCRGIFLETDDPWFAAGIGQEILARARGYALSPAVATSGYLCGDGRERLLERVDAVELILYGVSGSVYRRLFAVRPEPVLETVASLASRRRVAVEVVVPLLPGENDSSDEVGELSRFLAERLGASVPVRFVPEETSLPDERLASACAAAHEAGLSDVSARGHEVSP